MSATPCYPRAPQAYSTKIPTLAGADGFVKTAQLPIRRVVPDLKTMIPQPRGQFLFDRPIQSPPPHVEEELCGAPDR